MINKHILLTLFMAIGIYASNGQNMYGSVGVPDNYQPHEPGANMVSVDLYTGTGSVNIPIYDYSLAGLNLGVSLSYNAKGIKVDQAASSIGLGWSLNAGGSITRQVKGLEDEVTTSAKFSGANDYMSGSMVPGAKFNDYYNGNTTNKVDDQEHDLFYLDLCGRQLTLQLYIDSNQDLRYITYPKSEIKIEFITKEMYPDYFTDTMAYTTLNIYDPPPGSGNPIIVGTGNGNPLDTVLTFNVTDEKGNKFFFEMGEYEIKNFKYYNSALEVDEGTYFPASKWDLVKVVTATGFTVTYDYKWTLIDSMITSISEVIDQEITFDYDNTQTPWVITDNPLTITENNWKGRRTHLYRINYPNGVQVNLNLDNTKSFSSYLPSVMARCDIYGDFLLESITVKSDFGDNMYNKITYDLKHAYFNTPKFGINPTEVTVGDNCQPIGIGWAIPSFRNIIVTKNQHYQKGYRLKLTGIERQYSNYLNDTLILPGSIEPLYEFEYYDAHMPYRFGSQKDYYGYYNGDSTIPVIVPNMMFNSGDSISGDWPRNDTLYLSIPKLVTLHNQSNLYSILDYAYPNNALAGTGRSHNKDSMKAWVLKKIHNNRGGEIEIKYKGDYSLSNPSNQYYHHFYYWGGDSISHDIDTKLEGVNVNDGLVVDTVIERDGASQEHTRKIAYIYTGGQRFNRGGYTTYPKHSDPNYSMCANYFVGPQEFFRGSNHGFSTVEKRLLGYNGEVLSKEVYQFTNLTFGTSPYTSMRKRTGDYYHTLPGELAKYRMGHPLFYKKYSINTSNNSTTYLKNEVVYEYETVDETPQDLQVSNDKIGLRSLAHFQGPTGSTNICGAEHWNNGIVHETYFPLDYKMLRLKTKKDREYFYQSGGGTTDIEIVTEYEYDDLHNQIAVTMADSKGDTFRTETWYNYRFKEWNANLYGGNPDPVQTIIDMTDADLQYPILNETWKIDNGNKDKLVSFTCSSPHYSGVLRFPASFGTKQKNLIDFNIVFPLSGPDSVNSEYINRSLAVGYAEDPTSTSPGKNLRMVSYAKEFDNGQNPLEIWNDDKKQVVSYIWDTRLSLKLAEVANAEYRDIAYTSFEDGNTYSQLGISQYNKGNWDFDSSAVHHYSQLPNQKPMTGYYAYYLETPSGMVPPTFINSRYLQAKKYILSFWAMEAGGNQDEPEVIIYDSATNSTVGNATLTEQNIVGDWKLYTAVIEANEADYFRITAIEDAAYYIDEIRLHPIDALMSSYTYEPFKGVLSTNDATNYIVYREYDRFFRYFRTRDLRGNIVEQLVRPDEESDLQPDEGPEDPTE